MQTETTRFAHHAPASPTSPTSSPARSRTFGLASLARLDDAALRARYAAGTVRPLSALDGHPRGRMLAVRHLDAPLVAAALRLLAGAARFPWGGKSFRAFTAHEGEGVNRVHVGGRHQLFTFRTRVASSVVDGAPAVLLDYDRADNPGFIRAVHDEIREIEEGLWLGPAMWKTETTPAHVLWFALETREQAAPIGAAAYRA